MGTQGLGITFLTLPLVVRAAAGGQWCYDSQDPKCGPSHWKELKASCGGDKQSPVNIDRRQLQRDGGLGDILFEGYDQAPPGKWRLANDGHTVMLSLESESIPEHITISSGGLPGRYRALQLHFHWGSPAGNGSEHTLDGHQLPMELHIVHINVKYRTLAEAKGHPNGLAVLGFFFQASESPNTNYNTIVAGLRNISRAGDSVDLASTFRLSTLLPPAHHLSRYYRYQGSLTTPDCSEVVVWTLFEELVEISQEQLRAFVSTLHFPPAGSTLLKMTNNFRPPQPLHGRKVFASRAATASSGSPCGGHHQLLSPLLLLALLAPLSPTP
ncbi:carbonic anhydrase 15 [Patagioenas fasciata monilis]|uniref:carbonic anhydrase n=1 Tax=Patagioenas fasciata monilis TaxID=372326 RepID=A0A1V4JT02_PATFA|nr:carbonic anhydrase 15 [Patagioenas fasciata monilis]